MTHTRGPGPPPPPPYTQKWLVVVLTKLRSWLCCCGGACVQQLWSQKVQEDTVQGHHQVPGAKIKEGKEKHLH